MQAEKSHIKFIDLTQLFNWSVQGLLDAKFSYSKNYELAKIGDFLIKSRQVVNVKDEQTYSRVTVRINNNGVLLRNTEKGINIGTKKQYLASAGQFIVSKIDARNGAFGIIPAELDGAIVTNDFPLFNVNTKRISPQFLLLVTTTRHFIKFAQSCSSGTTNRQRMDIDLFLEQKIPLPSIKEQEKILKEYNSKINKATSLKSQADNVDIEIEKYLSVKLGVSYETKQKRKGIYFVDFSVIKRWDVWNINLHLNQSKHNIVKLSNLIKLKSGNFLPANKMIAGKYIVYGGNGKSGMHNDYFLEGKRLVIGRVGEYCGNVHLIDGKYWITDNAFIVDLLSSDTAPEFLEIALNFFNLNKYRVISAQPSISQSAILNLDFPLPDNVEQEKIIKQVYTFRNNQLELIQLSAQLIKSAIAEFEKTIF